MNNRKRSKGGRKVYVNNIRWNWVFTSMGPTRWVLLWTLLWGWLFLHRRKCLGEAAVLGSFGSKVFLGFRVREKILKRRWPWRTKYCQRFFFVNYDSFFCGLNYSKLQTHLLVKAIWELWKTSVKISSKTIKKMISQKYQNSQQSKTVWLNIKESTCNFQIFVSNTRGKPCRRFNRA